MFYKIISEVNMKALVTGGTGFIGSHIVEKLCKQGFSVRCISRDYLNTEELKSLNVEIIIKDLNDNLNWENILSDVDIVYHIAGVTQAQYYKEYYERNYLATKKLVEACSAHCRNLRRFVYLSSLTAVGPSIDGKPVDETTAYHPVSDYGKSKMLAEIELLAYKDRIPITILRPSAVYGPRERNFYLLIKSIKRGFNLCMGLNSKFTNMIYVEDLVEAIISASTKSIAEGQVYFIGSEVAYPNEVICETIARIVNKKPINVYIPHCFIYLVCGINELAGKIFKNDVFLNIQKARELTQAMWNCSIEKAKQELGFTQKVSLYEGFMNTYQWYVKMGWV
ncbi:MAG: hypothetical protein B6D44_08685 [Ignavibacteriales bacterium UTCHB2]|nr:MAG: hypothetical protein B6D44_08685 [Ignavibacteriales bacterium UTCHB2]